jgi:hypothetical protein
MGSLRTSSYQVTQPCWSHAAIPRLPIDRVNSRTRGLSTCGSDRDGILLEYIFTVNLVWHHETGRGVGREFSRIRSASVPKVGLKDLLPGAVCLGADLPVGGSG